MAVSIKCDDLSKLANLKNYIDSMQRFWNIQRLKLNEDKWSLELNIIF